VAQTVTSAAGVANPPPYTQCVMVSPQIQFVASPQPVVIPSSQQMIINQNGQQFQIVNTNPSIPQGAQIIQTANGTQLIQTQQVSVTLVAKMTNFLELKKMFSSLISSLEITIF